MPHTDQHSGFQGWGGGGGEPTCREVLNFLMAYLDGELPPPARAEFEQHLSICPSCVNYLEGYRATVSLARGVRGSESEGLQVPASLLAAIRSARKGS